jgi:hypothetical protein
LVCKLNLVSRNFPFGRCFITTIEVGRAIVGIGPCYCLYSSCQVFLLFLKFNHFWCFCDSYWFFIASVVWLFLRSRCFLNSIAFEFHTIISMVLQCSNQLSCNGHEQWTFWQWRRRNAWTSFKNDKCLMRNILKHWVINHFLACTTFSISAIAPMTKKPKKMLV